MPKNLTPETSEPIIEPAAVVSPTVEIGEWCWSQVGKYDFSLLGAFEATMKSRNKYVATVAEFSALYDAFCNEPAP